jgi:hypothetical protein
MGRVANRIRLDSRAAVRLYRVDYTYFSIAGMLCGIFMVSHAKEKAGLDF